MKSWLIALLLLVPSLALADERVSVIDAMLAEHNAFRAKVGLPAQQLDPGLCSFAQYLADKQAVVGQMFHSGPEWIWPECVCYGATDGRHAVAMWIDSPPHRAILCLNMKAVGFGFNDGFAAALFGEPIVPQKPDLVDWRTDSQSRYDSQSPADKPAESPPDQLALADGLLLPVAPRVCVDGSCSTSVVSRSSTVVAGRSGPLRSLFLGGRLRGRCGRGGCR